VATPARDSAAVIIAQGKVIVSRLARECVALVGRAESPQSFIKSWGERNARYVNASTRYLEQRLEEAEAAGGKPQREAMAKEINAFVESSAEADLRSLFQGRKEDACMRAVTLLDTGVLDISSASPGFQQIEALVRWAEQ